MVRSEPCESASNKCDLEDEIWSRGCESKESVDAKSDVANRESAEVFVFGRDGVALALEAFALSVDGAFFLVGIFCSSFSMSSGFVRSEDEDLITHKANSLASLGTLTW